MAVDDNEQEALIMEGSEDGDFEVMNEVDDIDDQFTDDDDDQIESENDDIDSENPPGGQSTIVTDGFGSRATFSLVPLKDGEKSIFAVQWLAAADGSLTVVFGGEDEALRTCKINSDENGVSFVADSVTIHSDFSDSIAVCKVSVDGKWLAAGGLDGIIAVYKIDKNTNCITLQCKLEVGSSVEWLQWHPKGPALLTGLSDSTVWVWNAPACEVKHVFSGHGGVVTCGQFAEASLKGQSRHLAVTGSSDGTVIVWDCSSGQVVSRCQLSTGSQDPEGSGVVCLDCYQPSGVVAAGCMDGTIHLIEMWNGTIVKSLNSHELHVEQVAFAPPELNEFFGEFLLASGGADGKLILWSCSAGSERSVMFHNIPDSAVVSGGITRLIWAKNKPQLITSGTDGTVRVWNAANGEEELRYAGHTLGVLDFEPLPEGFNGELVTCGDDGNVIIF